MCKKNNIVKISNEYERKKAVNLVESDSFLRNNVPNFENRIEELFNRGCEEDKARELEIAKKRDDKIQAELLQKELEMNKYASLYGTEKKKQMLLDRITQEEKQLKVIKQEKNDS